MKGIFAAVIGIISSISIISVFLFSASVYAIPSMPTIFYGTVTAGELLVPDGTIVSAEINGRQYAEGITVGGKYGGDLLFRIPVDDPETRAKDGWSYGDQLYFYVNGVQADQVVIFNGAYESGLNYEVNLSVSCLATPTPTPTATPLPGDLTGDGECNILDIVLVCDQWGTEGAPCFIPEDLNCDGHINVLDIVVICNNWGR